MPATVNADFMSLVHAASNGISAIFPDVCKTPTPGGPVPIPYPNIAMSSDTADGSSTVKVDGNPIMLKGSNYRMSTGDEAGAAMGVVSNKIKGKAEPILYSFDVKVDGKNVFRLADIMQQNVGNPGNTPPGTNLQPPVIAIPIDGPECKRTHAEKKKQKQTRTAWGKSGVISEHQGPIQSVATKLKVVIYFRQTKAVCEHWIRAKHQPKPHSCMSGTTIKPSDVPKVQAWLDDYFERMTPEERQKNATRVRNPLVQNQDYSDSATDYIGVIGIPIGPEGNPIKIMPKKGGGRQTASYTGKWMTGDYDLFEMLENGDQCRKVSGDSFARVKKEINKRLKWDAIQHPPQAQWVPNKKERAAGVAEFDMNKEVQACIRGEQPLDKKLKWHPKRDEMAVIDKPLTVVAGNGVVTLEDEEKVKDALVCQGCAK